MQCRAPAGADTRTLVGLAIAGIGAIAVAVLLVPLRDDIDTSNLALILVVVVVLAAIVGNRLAAALAAVVATMEEVARLVLIGNPDVAVSVEERIIAVAVADQLGAAIAMAPRETVEQLGKELHAS
jgi:hypothetical protein